MNVEYTILRLNHPIIKQIKGLGSSQRGSRHSTWWASPKTLFGSSFWRQSCTSKHLWPGLV